MATALIIGASRGIGHEMVRQLLAAGWQVHATARSEQALQDLRALGAQAYPLDVTDPEALAALGWQLDGARLDLAVYVSGIYGPSGQRALNPPLASDFDAVMHTNVLGAMQAMPLVAPWVEAADGKLVLIGSAMGSLSLADNSHGWLYRVSKAALGMVLRAAVPDYPRATMVVMHPGWVRTDLGGENATLSVEKSVVAMLKVIAGLKHADSGSFYGYDGKIVPW